jgi:hypothetical protein
MTGSWSARTASQSPTVAEVRGALPPTGRVSEKQVNRKVGEQALGSQIRSCTWGAKFGGAVMPKDRLPYEASAWALTRERIGWLLRERYRIPKELPPILPTLVGKIDAFERRKRQRAHLGTMRELLGLWSFDPLA